MPEPLEIQLNQLLAERGAPTLATAESCTGGSVASRIASVAGSSAYYLGSVVSYSNEVKHNVLGVSLASAGRAGAVSAECARDGDRCSQGNRQRYCRLDHRNCRSGGWDTAQAGRTGLHWYRNSDLAGSVRVPFRRRDARGSTNACLNCCSLASKRPLGCRPERLNNQVIQEVLHCLLRSITKPC